MHLKLIGLDPSLSNLGVANVTLNLDDNKIHVDNLTLVETEPEKDKKLKKVVRKNSEDLERAKLLYQGMSKCLGGAQIAIAEVPVGSQSARAMASYGASVMLLATLPIPLIQVTPTEVKVAATGIKSATKQEMIEWAVAKYPYAPWLRFKRGGVMVLNNANEHLADALGAIEAGIASEQFKAVVQMYRGLKAA